MRGTVSRVSRSLEKSRILEYRLYIGLIFNISGWIEPAEATEGGGDKGRDVW